jgi:Fic family protein
MDNLLVDIQNKKTSLDKLRPLDNSQIQNLKKLYDTELTYNSNAIEGNTLTYSETKLVLNEGITIGGKSVNEHLEAINHKEAIDYIEELAFLKTSELTLRDIKNIHNLVLKGINTKEAGIYRSKPVGVMKSDGVIHHFTDPLMIDEQMQEFIVWLNGSLDIEPIKLAALVHLKFVTIHPFIDGNGRTARLLMNLVLLQNRYPHTIVKVSSRVEYIQAIEKAQSSTSADDTEDFYNFILNSVNDSLDLYLEVLNTNIKLI